MNKALASLITSKKFIVMLAGVIVAFVAEVTPIGNLDETAVATILAPIMAYIVGQGIADTGKEKAKVEQDASVST